MQLAVGSATDVGQLRSLNEDSLLVAGDLFAVADGMGGHRGGEVASARALVAFQAASTERTLESLMGAVQAANDDVLDHARSSPDLMGMGTTLCALAPLDDHRVAIVNVGDSRVYLLRDGHLFQVSEDHSFVESLVREGRLTRAQADVHPQRNVITRALGIEPYIDVDGWEAEVRTGDRFLLCSDGLFNEVTDPDIEAILVAETDPVHAAGRLIDAANAGGGRDNITCVVVDVSGIDEAVGAAAAPIGRPIEDSLTRRSTAADLDETSIDDPTLDAAPAAPTPDAASSGKQPHARRFGWRTIVFLLAIVLTFTAALVATDWYYKNTYSVGAKAGKVVIVRGPANTNILWFKPQITTTEVALAQLDDAERTTVRNGIEGLTLTQANRYVDRLEALTATTTTTTTTTSTTTSIPTTGAADTTVPPAP